MTSRERWLLVIAAGLLGCLAVGTLFRHITPDLQPSKLRMEGSANPYSTQEIRAFLDAAGNAEAIADPLQRCLDYPDLPGSHWSRAAVVAYCRNQLTPGITFREVKTLIEAGRASAVERRMEELLQRQLAGSGTPGLLDATYDLDFACTCSHTDVRPVVDAWKRQSPQSAFAYAASGVARVREAWDARGTAWAAETSQSKFEAMQRLSTEAADDLQRAVAMDKRMMPAYAAMIRLAGLNGEREYALTAARRGLEIDPADYLIWSRLIWISQPKWGGSIAAMQKVVAESQRHVMQNPLLLLLQHQADAVAAGFDDCGCTEDFDSSAFRAVFDQVIAKSWLGGAGLSANKVHQEGTAVIYLSEALRFAPQSTDYLVGRSNSLTSLGLHDWAVADADRAIKLDPGAKTAWTARGYAYESVNDFVHAEQDFQHALTLIPDDTWTLTELGRIYVYSTHDWDKGWSVANQLIQSHPEDPDGWIFRASIQKDQPRPGLQDTIRYFIAHFGDDPQQQPVIAQMRPYLAQH